MLLCRTFQLIGLFWKMFRGPRLYVVQPFIIIGVFVFDIVGGFAQPGYPLSDAKLIARVGDLRALVCKHNDVFLTFKLYITV